MTGKTLKIDSHIPAPEKHAGGTFTPNSSEFTETLAALRVGQSFYIDRNSASVGRHIYQWRRWRGSDRDFVVRSEGKGTRVWRVK